MFFSFGRQPDINQGVLDYQSTQDAVLLDVRTPQEYREGHIPGSENIPLAALDQVEDIAASTELPLFVYCQSGARSHQAVYMLQDMGYCNVTNIGGIAAYRGTVVR